MQFFRDIIESENSDDKLLYMYTVHILETIFGKGKISGLLILTPEMENEKNQAFLLNEWKKIRLIYNIKDTRIKSSNTMVKLMLKNIFRAINDKYNITNKISHTLTKVTNGWEGKVIGSYETHIYIP